jgi:hypothetical protein
MTGPTNTSTRSTTGAGKTNPSGTDQERKEGKSDQEKTGGKRDPDNKNPETIIRAKIFPPDSSDTAIIIIRAGDNNLPL